MQNLDNMDRRQALKACAAALALGITGCGRYGSRSQNAAFTPVDPQKLGAAGSQISKSLTDMIVEGVNRSEGMRRGSQLTFETGINESTLYGTLSQGNHRFGHGLLINGSKGFARIEIYATGSYIEPLIVSRGQAQPNFEAQASSCCTTSYCTNSTNGTRVSHDFNDTGGEDPCPGSSSFGGFIDPYSQPEIDFLSSTIRIVADLMEGVEQPTLEALQEKLDTDEASPKAIMAVEELEGGSWTNILINFSNGTAAMVQVAIGDFKPAVAMNGKIDLSEEADISFVPSKTNVDEVTLFFPKVTGS